MIYDISDDTSSSSTQYKILCYLKCLNKILLFRSTTIRRKTLWISLSITVAIVVVTAIVIPTTLIFTKKTSTTTTTIKIETTGALNTTTMKIPITKVSVTINKDNSTAKITTVTDEWTKLSELYV